MAQIEKPRPLPGFRLEGEDGNAFFIMGRFHGAASKAKLSKETIAAVLADAKNGDYDHLIQVFLLWSED